MVVSPQEKEKTSDEELLLTLHRVSVFPISLVDGEEKDIVECCGVWGGVRLSKRWKVSNLLLLCILS